jgi:predicted  nucleic acid-binding Zn-ribbon protein
MFAKFFEIVGHLVGQNYNIYLKETSYKDIDVMVKDLKEFAQGVNKSAIVEKLKELDKTKSAYSKRKSAYEKAIVSTEEAIKKAKEVRSDPTLAYDLSIKESTEEKAASSIKDLEFKKEELKNCIDGLNALQKECIECIEELRATTKQAINDYIGAMLNI